MKNTEQERALAYTLSIPLSQALLTEIAGGAQAHSGASARMILTGDHTAPDVIFEF